jgi:hypothetical protein
MVTWLHDHKLDVFHAPFAVGPSRPAGWQGSPSCYGVIAVTGRGRVGLRGERGGYEKERQDDSGGGAHLWGLGGEFNGIGLRRPARSN